jgi:hypothetical protein
MSSIEVDKIVPATGTSLTLGDSGDTFTIPSGVTLTNNGTATGFGVGKIGQVVQAETTTETQITSTSYTDTTLTGSITPSSATSKILVDVRGFYLIDATSLSTGRRGNHRLIRTISGSDTVLQTDEHELSTSNSSTNVGPIFQIGYQYLDSPSTTSACSYKIQINVDQSPYRANFPHDGNKATITLMEVLA